MKANGATGEDETQPPLSEGTKTPRALRVVIAGGVTGGHLFPGIAIAQEFMARNAKNSVTFAGTDRPFETSVLSETGFGHMAITAQGIKGLGFMKKIMSVLKIPRGIVESVLFLNRFRPDIVVGVGGYAAGPVALGAWLLGIKIVLHEQNILPGITNRILSRFAQRIYVSFTDTIPFLNGEKAHFTGNPVRREILQCAEDVRDRDSAEFEVVPEQKRPFKILVIGGSQGAKSINTAVIDAIGQIKAKHAFYFVHQTGIQDEKRVKEAYARHGISNTVKSFFSDMARQYRHADLVICRAGATTVAEIAVIGKGVIFIPFPYAADNHQALNAQTLARKGAAEMILEKDLDGKKLAGRIGYYASNPETLKTMADNVRRFGNPDAARDIVDDCYRLVAA
jgi:UDP-N-acetylglucosamine--N-acetylmuramyl-(pentapeptide) pyrophosphoryl-undecaprenol N-acetylglucosamine transferase